jgi:hypothetical protein
VSIQVGGFPKIGFELLGMMQDDVKVSDLDQPLPFCKLYIIELDTMKAMF